MKFECDLHYDEGGEVTYATFGDKKRFVLASGLSFCEMNQIYSEIEEDQAFQESLADNPSYY